ncbi:hypothetical protein BC943DRAFT_321803 [Umbelopsis sp. AD052]|nr:hypothetical protein BC943DRAFT_321803 [Umbelopsis sp. AD052]
MTEAPRRSRSRSANTTPRMAPQQAPIPGTPPQMQGYPAGGQPQPPLPNQQQQQQAAASMNHQNMAEGYPNTPYMQQQQMGQQQQGERGIFSGFRRKMREAAGFINTDPYSERAYGPQMMPPHQQPMQHGYGNGAASPGAYAAGQHYPQQGHMPQQNPQMMQQQQYMQQQYAQQHNPQYMGASGNPYAHSMGYAQTPVMMQQQSYGGMAYPYGQSSGYYNRGSYGGGSYSPYGQSYGGGYGGGYGGAYGGGYGAGAYGSSYGYGGAGGGYGSYGMGGGYPNSYGYGSGGAGYMGYPRQVPIYDEHGKRIHPEHNYVSSVKDLWSSDLL